MHGWLNMQSTWRTHGENQLLMPDDHRIFEIAVDLIRSASMKHEHWRVTALATVHKLPTLPIVLQGEECVIIATAFPDGDWYAWTTRRLLAHCEGVDHEMLSRDAMEADFGMFKGSPELMTDPLAPSSVASCHNLEQVRKSGEVSIRVWICVNGSDSMPQVLDSQASTARQANDTFRAGRV